MEETSAERSAPVRVGVSGWSYPGWRGDYYPAGVPRGGELAYLSHRLTTVEVNASFYRLQRPATWQRWAAAVPDGFRFAVKGSRYLTHIVRLRDARRGLSRFFASGLLALGPRLGPVLWQLPARGAPQLADLASFCDLLPRTLAQAADLARTEQESQDADSDAAAVPVRHAVEVRGGIDADGVEAVLRERGIALVVSEGAGQWPLLERHCADFAYVRLHGTERLYGGGYDARALDRWARRIRSWGMQTWVYFDNDADGRAPWDAEGLAARLRR